jgi:hypothetical protein
VGTVLTHADGRTDKKKLSGAFCDYEEVPTIQYMHNGFGFYSIYSIVVNLSLSTQRRYLEEAASAVLNLGARRGWVENSRPGHFSPWRELRCPLNRRLGGNFEEKFSSSLRFRTLDHPTHSLVIPHMQYMRNKKILKFGGLWVRSCTSVQIAHSWAERNQYQIVIRVLITVKITKFCVLPSQTKSKLYARNTTSQP